MIAECRTHLFHTVFGEISDLRIVGVGDDMNVRVVRFIMKSTVPFQVFQGNPQCVSQLLRVRTKEQLPCTGVVIPEPFRVLAAQRDNHRPHISFVRIEICRNL